MTSTNKRQSLEYYLGLKYPITIEEAPEGGYFVQVEDLPGCFSQGETVDEAQEMIEEARQLWLESAYEDGLDIPEPHDHEEKYSGKFNVRLPKELHRQLDRLADKEGVSLNQFLVATLSRAVGVREGREQYEAAAKKRKTRAKQKPTV